jgi:murein endopeptidase
MNIWTKLKNVDQKIKNVDQKMQADQAAAKARRKADEADIKRRFVHPAERYRLKAYGDASDQEFQQITAAYAAHGYTLLERAGWHGQELTFVRA